MVFCQLPEMENPRAQVLYLPETHCKMARRAGNVTLLAIIAGFLGRAVHGSTDVVALFRTKAPFAVIAGPFAMAEHKATPGYRHPNRTR